MLSLLFFLVFLPIGLAFRLLGRDRLRLRRQAAATYWNPRAEGPSRYFRQF